VAGRTTADLTDHPDLPTRVGRRLRERRMALGLTLGETARLADMSDSHLSAIEIGNKVASLPILARIVSVLELSLHDVLQDVARSTVHIGRLPTDLSGTTILSHSDLLLRVAYLGAEPGDAGSSPVPTPGSEVFVYLREGELEITIDGEPYLLGPGDSLDTDPVGSITYRATGDIASVSIWAAVSGGDEDRQRR